MKLRRTKAPMQGETIVSLIDVVFFLLVFFMLVGRMDATAPFEVTPPRAQVGDTMPGGGSTISVARDGTLALDGRVMSRDALVDALTTLKPDLVRINADAGAELRHFLPLTATLQAAGLNDIVLVVTPNPP